MGACVGVGLSTAHIRPNDPFSSDFDLAEYYRDHHALLTRSELEFLSMADGRVGNGLDQVHHFDKEEATLELSLGGSLVTAKPLRPVGGGQVGGGLRGFVTGYSSASRRRQMRLIASLERDERPIFATLTYPDVFTDDIARWKRDIKVFGQRLARHAPELGFVWRIEFKERLSGASVGRVAPHFHLLIYKASYADLRSFVPRAWYDVVGSGSKDHLKAGTRVERIHSYAGIMRYVGKYITKVEDFPLGWAGRVWGVIGRARLPFAPRVIISLSEQEGKSLVRLGRKMLGLKGKTLVFGLTWIMNAGRLLDYLEFLQGFT